MSTKDRPSNDSFFLTTAEAADILRVEPRTIVNFITNKQLGAIKAGSDYRIPRGALDDYQRRHATSPEVLRYLPPVVHHSRRDLQDQMRELEQATGMSTEEFVTAYNEDPDAEQWTRRHHRWAAIVDAMKALQQPA